ncbi:MAG: O-antigen ligase family protein, partial [Cyclobacteriaceae bacterium]|nr:O-antigen ligase family protein [Cyclobacteriaceae bacterium]
MNLVSKFSMNELRANSFAFSCALIVFALPYSIQLTSLAIMILVIAWLIQGNWRTLLIKIRTAKWFWGSTILIYLLTIVSLAYTDEIKAGLFELEKGVALLLFPILFVSSHKLSKQAMHRIMWAFILSNLSLGLISVVYAVYKFFYEQVNIFFYHDLVQIFDSHATYYSMYLIFSLIALFYLYIKAEVPWAPRLLVGSITAFFTVLICLLGARSTVIIFFLASLVAIVIYIMKTKRIILGLTLMGCFFLLIFLVINNNAHLKERIVQLRDYKYQLSENHVEGYNGLTTRLAQWEASMSIVKEAPILGVGVGDV